jgi:hypothetical protein
VVLLLHESSRTWFRNVSCGAIESESNSSISIMSCYTPTNGAPTPSSRRAAAVAPGTPWS